MQFVLPRKPQKKDLKPLSQEHYYFKQQLTKNN